MTNSPPDRGVPNLWSKVWHCSTAGQTTASARKPRIINLARKSTGRQQHNSSRRRPPVRRDFHRRLICSKSPQDAFLIAVGVCACSNKRVKRLRIESSHRCKRLGKQRSSHRQVPLLSDTRDVKLRASRKTSAVLSVNIWAQWTKLIRRSTWHLICLSLRRLWSSEVLNQDWTLFHLVHTTYRNHQPNQSSKAVRTCVHRPQSSWVHSKQIHLNSNSN